MPLDQVWAVGGGAENTVEGARLSLYAAMRGARGVILPGDMKVSALPVPGPYVRVVRGAATSPNDYLGVDGGAHQYAGRESESSDVPVAPTGSSGGQTKYLIWAVHDEQYERGLTPVDKVKDLRNKYEWVSTINGLTFPHVPLVRLDQPANTATITNAMLTDIRELADPRKDFGIYARPRISADEGAQIKLTNSYINGSSSWWGELFPGGAGIPNQGTIFLPHYATHMIVDANFMGIRAAAGQNSWGRYWIEYGDEYRAHTWAGGKQYEFATQQFGFDTTGSGSTYRTNWPLTDAVPIPKKLRGKNVTFAFKAGLHPNASTSGITMDALGGVKVRVDYTERAVDADTI